jgi:hypothetical protein
VPCTVIIILLIVSGIYPVFLSKHIIDCFNVSRDDMIAGAALPLSK